MDISLDEVIHFDAISSSSTGAAADADSTPTFAVYEESTDTDIGVGGNMTKRTSLTGNYRGSFTASAANGFELGKWYNVIGSATIGGIATKGILKSFRIIAAENTAGYPPVDTVKFGGTTQTARDVGNALPANAPGASGGVPTVDASNAVKVQSGTGANQISLSSGLVTVGTNNDKTGYSLTQSFPSNFASLSITAGGVVKADLDTIKTQTVTCSAGVTVSPFVGSTGAAINGTNANTLSSHDPGATLGTSTLTQAQVTGGAYALNSASFAFNAALDLTTTQKASVNTEADTAASDYGALKPTTAGRTLDVSTGGEAGIDWANVGSPDTLNSFTATTIANVASVSVLVTNNDKTGYALTSAYDFAKGTVAMTESYNADGSAPTPVQSLFVIMQSLTEGSISGTTWTIKKLDGTTTAATITLDSATTPTSKTRAS